MPYSLPGRPDRQGRQADGLHRRRHLGRHPAHGGHEGLEEHHRHQQGRRGPDLLDQRPRHRRRRPQGPARRSSRRSRPAADAAARPPIAGRPARTGHSTAGRPSAAGWHGSGGRARSRPTWTNWAGNQSCSPARDRAAAHARTDLVRRRAASGRRGRRRVKVVGRRALVHRRSSAPTATWSTWATTTGCCRVDVERGQVTVQAGIPLSKLNVELARHGLALENLGDIAYQSVAGATSTATHGTGLQLRQPLEPHRRPAHRGRRRHRSSRPRPSATPTCSTWPGSGVGALGVLSVVTIQCVPAFNLHALEQAERVDDVLERVGRRDRRQRPLRVLLGPEHRVGADQAQPAHRRARRAPPRWRAFRDDYLLTNLGFDLTCRAGRLAPDARARGWPSCVPGTGRADYIDASYKVFASPRLVQLLRDGVRHPQRAPGRGAQPGARRSCDRQGVQILFPVEVRVVAADDIPLSTAYGRDDRLHRGARLPGHRLRPVLPGRRGDHGRLRRPAPLGEDALPDRRRPWRPATRAGTTFQAMRRPASTPTAASPAPTSTACSAPSGLNLATWARASDCASRREGGRSDQGPGVAAAGVVDREAALGDDGPGPGEHGVALERRRAGREAPAAGRGRPAGRRRRAGRRGSARRRTPRSPCAA